MSGIDWRPVWAPQPGPQHLLTKCPYPLIGFGGARGGGKTDGVLGTFALRAEQYGKAFNAVFFRKELPQADDLIERAREIYVPLGARFNGQDRKFEFPSGARIRFRPLETDADAEKYQGQNLTHAAVEEAGNYADPKPIWKLFGALRSSSGVPAQLILTFNPGGAGHYWLRQKFIVPARQGLQRLPWTLPNGRTVDYVYIPSRITDNRILLAKDPGYVDRLHLVGSPELVRAWLEGDFEIHEGSYFPTFGQRHICGPINPPQHWPRYMGFDWGYNSPFCAVFGAVSSGKDDEGRESQFPKGAIVIYREVWGQKVDNAVIARRILELSAKDPATRRVGDPSIWKHDGGPSIADQLREAGLSLAPADNERISGWNQIRRRLFPDPAMLYISTACPYLLETLPALQMDPNNHEDADTTGEDHAPDALRYLCKERVLEGEYVKVEDPVRHGIVRVSQLVDSVRRELRRPRL